MSDVRLSDDQISDYLRFRGKCKEMSEELVSNDVTLTLVRGYYYDAVWGKQAHWWVKDKDGKIIDPSKNQFPTKGHGIYEEFDGYAECEYCGKEVHEDDAYMNGHHIYCSYECAYRDVM